MTKSELDVVLKKIEDGIQVALITHPFQAVAFRMMRGKIIDPALAKLEAELLAHGVLTADPVVVTPAVPISVVPSAPAP